MKYNGQESENHTNELGKTNNVTKESDIDEDSKTANFLDQVALTNANLKQKGNSYNCKDNDQGHQSKKLKKTPLDENKENNPPKTGKVCNILGANMVKLDSSDDSGDKSDGNDFGVGWLLNTVGKIQPLTSTQQIVLTNKEMINSNWILLDNQSMVNIFKLEKLLRDIGPATENIRCFCNGGYQDTYQSGIFDGAGEVYYNNTSLANILSYSLLGERYRITSDTWIEDSFTIHDFQGRDMKFICSKEGLYYHDMCWGKSGVPPHLLKSI